MHKFLIYFLFSLLFFSCKKKETANGIAIKEISSNVVKEKKFEMYKMSEMALLMEQMYVENSRLKKRISKGELIGKFPDYFLKIYTSKLTDKTDNDDFFKEKAALFIASQKLLYSDKNTANSKINYNLGIDACIKCHENKCGGPIAKIKRLYIK